MTTTTDDNDDDDDDDDDDSDDKLLSHVSHVAFLLHILGFDECALNLFMEERSEI